MKHRVIFAILFAIAALLCPTPAMAMSLPDSTPSVEKFNAYRNLRQSNDMLVLVYANIPYNSTPTTLATSAFVWRLFSENGTTELGSTTGYVYHANGYGYNLYSMYFDNTTAPAWGGLYQVKLCGNPTVFTSPPVYNYTISASDYSSMTDTTDVQTELATRILTIAADLNVKWGLTATEYLTTQTEAATVLSLYGETFFRGTVYGIQAFAPALFQVVVKEITNADRNWNTTFVSSLTGQWAGTYIATAKQAAQDFFKTDWDLLSMVLAIVAVFGVIFANIALAGDAWNGLIDGAFVLVITARLGMYGLGFLALLDALCIVYIGVKFKQQGIFGGG